MKRHALFQGEIIPKKVPILSNPLPKNNEVNFKHTWHKASLGDGVLMKEYTFLERGGSNDEY